MVAKKKLDHSALHGKAGADMYVRMLCTCVILCCGITLVHGEWHDWSTWSNCSVSCGEGNQTRTRNCSNLTEPDYESGGNCTGDDLETQICSSVPCGIDAVSLSTCTFNFTSTATSIQITWSYTSIINVSYTIMCPNMNTTIIVTSPVASCHDLQPETLYDIGVRVVNDDFPDSDLVNVTFGTQLMTVQNTSVVLKTDGTSLQVTWLPSSVSNVTYELRCGNNTVQSTKNTTGTCPAMKEATLYELHVVVISDKYSKSEASSVLFVSQSKANVFISANSININWKPIQSTKYTVSYEIVRSDVSARVRRSASLETTVVTEPQFRIDGLPPYTTYNYTGMTIVNDSSNTWKFPLFDLLPVTTNQSAATPCRNFTCSPVSNEYNSVQCSWQTPEEANGVLIGYKITLLSQTTTLWQTENKSTLSAVVTSTDIIKPDIDLTFVVVATGEKFDSEQSTTSPIRIKPGPPFIAIDHTNPYILKEYFTTMPSKSYTHNEFQVKASFSKIFTDRQGKITHKFLLIGFASLLYSMDVEDKYEHFFLHPGRTNLPTWKFSAKGRTSLYALDADTLKISDTGYYTLGEDKTCDGDCNGPLVENADYFVAAAACTSVSCRSVGFKTQSTSPEPFPLQIIAAVVGGIVALLLVIVIVVAIVKSRKRSSKELTTEVEQNTKTAREVCGRPRPLPRPDEDSRYDKKRESVETYYEIVEENEDTLYSHMNETVGKEGLETDYRLGGTNTGGTNTNTNGTTLEDLKKELKVELPDEVFTNKTDTGRRLMATCQAKSNDYLVMQPKQNVTSIKKPCETETNLDEQRTDSFSNNLQEDNSPYMLPDIVKESQLVSKGGNT